jgi:hypothetical protein
MMDAVGRQHLQTKRFRKLDQKAMDLFGFLIRLARRPDHLWRRAETTIFIAGTF